MCILSNLHLLSPTLEHYRTRESNILLWLVTHECREGRPNGNSNYNRELKAQNNMMTYVKFHNYVKKALEFNDKLY
jgi:hypothetical protein